MFKEIISLALAAMLTLPCALTSADPGAESAVFAGTKAVAVLESTCLQTAIDYEADTVCNVAGLSRLPALTYVCEAFDKGLISEDASVVVGDTAAGIGGPTAFISAGEKIQAAALVKAAVMITAGDATYALAETAAGSATLAEKAIADILTELNIGSGDFSLQTGKPSMTAKEVCALMARLARSPTYCKYSNLTFDEITHENGSKTELANPNKLIKGLEGCYAGSTGSSNEAGYCGAFAVTRGETSYVVAVLGAKNSGERFEAARDAANTAFSAYETIAAAKQGDVVASGIAVNGGMKRKVDAVSTKAVVLLVKKGGSWEVTTELPANIPAPVRKGDLIGYAVYSSNEGAQVRVALAAAEDVAEAGWGQLISVIMRMWVHG
ncbi:MAG TPA: hypothetical protein PK438_03830 [Clostridia bacterium]|nr:hypothetical protein [Clostridia bacterium]